MDLHLHNSNTYLEQTYFTGIWVGAHNVYPPRCLGCLAYARLRQTESDAWDAWVTETLANATAEEQLLTASTNAQANAITNAKAITNANAIIKENAITNANAIIKCKQ